MQAYGKHAGLPSMSVTAADQPRSNERDNLSDLDPASSHGMDSDKDIDEETDVVSDLPGSTSTDASAAGSGTAGMHTTSHTHLTAAERRDHSRKHSRVHSRNLSVFFPRPGSEAEQEADVAQANETFEAATSEAAVGTSPGDGGLSPTKSRKGHHRRHSVMQSINENQQERASHPHLRLNGIQSISTHADATHHEHDSRTAHNSADPPATSASHKPAVQAYAHHRRRSSSTLNGSSMAARLLSTPLWQILSDSSLPPMHRPVLVFGALHFLLGASLWMSGQAGDSLAMTGLGYLVVFDALGLLNGVTAEWLTGRWRAELDSKYAGSSSRYKPYGNVRQPYGPHRIETVLQFSQTVYLLFAAIYVCKESVEHALLEGTEEHHEQDAVGLNLPSGMLVLTTVACAVSNVLLQNHAKLVAACGLSTTVSGDGPLAGRRNERGHGRRYSVLVDPSTMAGPLLRLLANPFSVTVLFASVTLTLAALAMPPFQVAALDKVLAGLESAAMLYIAYPASKALGKVLLQTAPKEHDVQSVQLMRTLRTIETHRLVSYVAPPHLWQLTPPTSALTGSSSSSTDARLSARASLMDHAVSRTAKNAALIATVHVFVHDNATDADVLDLTRWAWQLLAPAVGAGAGQPVGESLRGALRAGEVIVQVSRESERSRYQTTRTCHHDAGDAAGHHHRANALPDTNKDDISQADHHSHEHSHDHARAHQHTHHHQTTHSHAHTH